MCDGQPNETTVRLPSPQRRVRLLLICVWVAQLPLSLAFPIISRRRCRRACSRYHTVPTVTTTFPTLSPSSSLLWILNDHEIDTAEASFWNASGSFGNLLTQMQKKEPTGKTSSSSPTSSLEVVDLEEATTPTNETVTTARRRVRRRRPKKYDGEKIDTNERDDGDDTKEKEEERNERLELEQEPLLHDKISWETARELDEAVVALTFTATSEEDWQNEVRVLPLDDLYQATQRQVQQQQNQQQQQPPTRPQIFTKSAASVKTVNTSSLPLLSQPRHYRDRIGRDMRHLAVSIAASTESVSQWRLFCQENGGLYPLLDTIQEGVRSLGPTRTTDAAAPKWWVLTNRRQEESFLLACQACRALRDLCALSPDLTAVLTDGVLRANAAGNGSLLRGLCTKLEYANDVIYRSEQDEKSAGSSETTLSRNKNGIPFLRRGATASTNSFFLSRRRHRRDAGLRCKLYITQLLLAMATASDDAIETIRGTPGLAEAIVACSSYARKEQRRRWLRYPGEVVKYFWRRTTRTNNKNKNDHVRRPFLEAANVANDLNGQVQRTANMVLAAIGHNRWVPKMPGQKGLRILCLDGGGSRGMVAITALNSLLQYVGNGAEVADSFDLVAGTSTGGIISFLTALRKETSYQALVRYTQLIKQIFVKSALSTPRMVFTTASYDESHFMDILSNILRDETMLDSRSDPSTPFVFCVTSKMSSTPTHVALFRNYNYAKGELADHFTLDPQKARDELDLPLSLEHELIRNGQYTRKQVSSGSPGLKLTEGSRHPGSFRVLQRYALRASTAAPTVFRPVMMGGEMYCDGGIVASNPAAVAIHEARTLFPDVPIELVISLGTGAFVEQKTSPRIGWDGIIGQIVGSACDGEQTHHVLEDILGDSSILGRRSCVSQTRYFRFNPVLGLPDEFPIDVTDPQKLEKMKMITEKYMNEPVQRQKMDAIAEALNGGQKWKLWFQSKQNQEETISTSTKG